MGLCKFNSSSLNRILSVDHFRIGGSPICGSFKTSLHFVCNTNEIPAPSAFFDPTSEDFRVKLQGSLSGVERPCRMLE